MPHTRLVARLADTEHRLDRIAARLHYALAGECPAYPKSREACNPLACDCLSPYEDMTAEELAEAVVGRLRPETAPHNPHEAR